MTKRLDFENISGLYVAQIDENNRIRLELDPNPMSPAEWDNADENDWQLYNDGEVYGIIRERKCEKCGQWEVLDSCWGFYGLIYAEESAQDYIEQD